MALTRGRRRCCVWTIVLPMLCLVLMSLKWRVWVRERLAMNLALRTRKRRRLIVKLVLLVVLTRIIAYLGRTPKRRRRLLIVRLSVKLRRRLMTILFSFMKLLRKKVGKFIVRNRLVRGLFGPPC